MAPFPAGLLFGGGLSLSQMVDIGRRAEEVGFEALFSGELAVRDAFLTLSAFAQNTRRARVGTSIVSIYTRSPVITAMAAATLDEMSGGRMVLGLGTSPPFYVEKWHSMEWGKPVQRMREFVPVVKKILANEKVNHEGPELTCKGFQLMFKPPRKDLPIWVAGVGPRMVGVAGEVGDGVLLSPLLCPEYMALAKEWLAAGARKAGRDPSKITVAGLPIVSVHEDRRKAIEAARVNVAFYCVVYYYKPVLEAAGFGERQDKIRETNKSKGLFAAAKLVTDDMVEKLAAVGTPEECRARLEELHRAGLQMPLLYPPQIGGDPKRGYESLLKI